jgi:hypothetical protein
LKTKAYRGEKIVKMYFKEMALKGADWINLALDRDQ